MSSYVSAKWAVHGLVRCLQIEARETPGVSVSLVSPGAVDTPFYRQAGTYVGRHGRPPPPVSTPEKVAEAIIGRLERPSRETPVGPANALILLGFRVFPGVFDRLVTPLMRLGGLARGQVDDTPGNVLHPRPAGEATHGAGPASVTAEVRAPASAVWATLSDGWLYASWVVGASRVREVDPSWPASGSRIHHSVGLWPTLINDETVVLEAVPEHRLRLQAKGWPLGEARVDLRIDELAADQCRVTIIEDAVKGPGKLLPRPARQPVITVRNREALRRLAMLAEGRHRERLTGG